MSLSNNTVDFADFLFEVGCEELPADQQNNLIIELKNILIAKLSNLNLQFAAISCYSTPRRLALIIHDLATHTPATNQQHRGPSLLQAFDASGNPTKAALGFARKHNTEVANLITIETPEGSWLYHKQQYSGELTTDILQHLIPSAIKSLTLPKHMRWGSQTEAFVRPVHWLVALFGTQVIPIQVFSLTASNVSYGHRFLHPQAITITEPGQYTQLLLKASVVASADKRKNLIVEQINNLFTEPFNALINEELLEIVTGLVEYPYVDVANFDEKYLSLPPECLISSIQNHQKCFPVHQHNNIAAQFVLVSQIPLEDSGIVAGNQRVMQARLEDALFHYNTDLKISPDERLENLKNVSFQHNLGNLYSKSYRIARLATWCCQHSPSIQENVYRAGLLCKTDLLSNMVFEFPELQGVVGGYYCHAFNEDVDVCSAVKQHYYPRFANDKLPDNEIACYLGIADRIDNIVGLFSLKKQITSDKDPFGIRRQAIAILRILIERNIAISLPKLLMESWDAYGFTSSIPGDSIVQFFADRLTAWLLTQGFNHNCIQACCPDVLDNPCDFYKRLQLLCDFEQNPDSKELVLSYKRVNNLLLKHKLDGHNVQTQYLVLPAEQDLYNFIINAEQKLNRLVKSKDYFAIITILWSLSPILTKFFAEVMVMDDDLVVRGNRLALLYSTRELFLTIGDFSRL